MKKDIAIESSDEAIDLGRRSMMSRFGLAASLTLAAPVMMTISTSTQATHKSSNEKGQGNCENMGGESSGNANAINNKAASCTAPDAPPPPDDDLGIGGLS
jgi:hypothetical protein